MLNTHLSIHCEFHSCYFFILSYFLSSSQQPTIEWKCTHNNQVSSLLRIWWRMIVVWCCFEEEEIIQHQETLIDFTRYILCYYYAQTLICVWMMDSDTNSELAFFYGLLIVNDDVNVHQNDWIMLWEYFFAFMWLTVKMIATTSSNLVIYKVCTFGHIEGLPYTHRILIEMPGSGFWYMWIAINLEKLLNLLSSNN